MRDLSSSLRAAQQASVRSPYVRVTASNRSHGVVRWRWERIYTGSEADYRHGMAIAGNGAMIRARISPPADGHKLYRQTVTSPGPEADFSSWTHTGENNCTAVAVAAVGNEVSIFWINTAREVRRIRSTNHGLNWGNAELIDYTPTAAGQGLGAAYKANGDLAAGYTDQTNLYIKKCIAGNWQAAVACDKTTGDLNGIGMVYDGDWVLLVAGSDAEGRARVWSLAYGDGGDVPAGQWSGPEAVAAAEAGAG